MTTLFRWTFTDGTASGTFARATVATFVRLDFPALSPAFVRGTDLSEPVIRVRDARGGETL